MIKRVPRNTFFEGSCCVDAAGSDNVVDFNE